MAEADVSVVEKPGTTSKVDEDGRPVKNGKAVCKICHSNVAAKSGNTSNLISHLRHKHPTVYAQTSFTTTAKASKTTTSSGNYQQTSIVGSFAQGQPYDRQSKRWNELTKTVTYCIVKDGLPLNSIEKDGFKQMLQKFDPRYEPPSRNYISRTSLPELYAATVEKVKKKLSKVTYFASTTDMWSSISLIPYFSYTIHFVDDEWKIQSLSLGTHFLPADHTAEILAEAMESTLREWELKPSQQVSLTTDNGSNIVAAAARLSWI